MIELLRSDQQFLLRSRDLVSSIEKYKDSPVGAYKIFKGLELVSASLILGDNQAANAYYQSYMKNIRIFLSDEDLIRKELVVMENEHEDVPLILASMVRNMAYVLISQENQSALSLVLCLNKSNPFYDYLGFAEYYLLMLSMNRCSEAISFKKENWENWLDDELIVEDDDIWYLGSLLVQTNEPDKYWSHLMALRQREEEQVKQGIVHPYTHRFSSTVLGLNYTCFIALGERYGWKAPLELSQSLGLNDLLFCKS